MEVEENSEKKRGQGVRVGAEVGGCIHYCVGH
jgi:hypothetical protein